MKEYRELKAGEVRQEGDEVLADISQHTEIMDGLIYRMSGDRWCSTVTDNRTTNINNSPKTDDHYWLPVNMIGVELLPSDLMCTRFRRPL